MSRPFWVTFTGGQGPGCIDAESGEHAREIAEAKFGVAVRTVDRLPYRSFPVLYASDAATDGLEPRCSDPYRCRGYISCQKRPSCSE